jgi:hypothetical protein
VDLTEKLQLRPGQGVVVTGVDATTVPALTGLATAGGTEAGVLAFVADRAALEGRLATVVAAASVDRLTWVAYPKSGQLGTDLNRDVLAARLTEEGVRPVRQVAIDDVWSALRFRPG